MSRGWLAVVLLLQAGCGALTGFSCLEDDQCRDGGRDGACVAGYCAYPDPGCPSGLRWSSVAVESYADRCVDVVDTTTDDPADATSSSTGDPSSSESSSTTMGPPVPFCGDGNVDPGEECDPADPDPDARPCDGCVLSGQLVNDFFWPHADNDAAWALALYGEDIIVAGYAQYTAEGTGQDIHVARHAPDGEAKWTYRRFGTMDLNDYARAVGITESGTIRVIGHYRPDYMDTDRDQFWFGELTSEGDLLDEAEFGNPETTDQPNALVLLDTTDFVVAGRIGGVMSSDFSIHRYSTATGDVALVWEDWFDGPGLDTDIAYALAYRDDGLLFAGGSWRSTATDVDRYLGAWMLDGSREPSPCDDGSHAEPLDAADEIRGLDIAPDGSIVAVGFAQSGTSQDAWVGVYEPIGCALEWQRSIDGMAHANDRAYAVVVDTEGYIITAGTMRDGTSDDTWLVKWDRADEGEIVWKAEPINGPGDGNDAIFALAIDDDGTIVVAGQLSQPNHSDIWVGRYTP